MLPFPEYGPKHYTMELSSYENFSWKVEWPVLYEKSE